ncbi:tetratricopeptide repeat domain-containing protein [Phthorimaea operculella]|nr:tetratricopeptide repeat domain-containing protein [Phthorimaea operculella]
MRALAVLTPHTPAKITIEVLRACGKACVVKRRFQQAGLLVRQAVALARRAFGPHHPRYAAALLDYGFYLLNIDSINHSQAGLLVRQAVALARRAFGPHHPRYAAALLDYGFYLLNIDSINHSQAGLLVRQAVALTRRAFGPHHPRYAAALLDYGFYLLNIDSINHSQAGLLVRQAVALARRAFGPHHPRYAAALLDYGFYLLNIDSINHSVAVYEEALSTLRRVFGRSSLHVATAQEDLAYALYVLEYSSGRFYKARDHAERAIRIIEKLVPPDHLLLASAKRVKALILEEIALDTPAGQDMSEPSLLSESESLHRAALALSMMAFGEKNVQTAKHYGNLGRLYQSMHKFQDAESMHLKAIKIKEELLGPEDYELTSVVSPPGLKLFGERYSGLEYDYRGLVHVFTQLKQHDRADHYTRLLQHWHELREQSKTEQQPAIGDEQVMPLQQLRDKLRDHEQ